VAGDSDLNGHSIIKAGESGMKANWQDYIRSDPQVLRGKPVIIGTRISVELILEKLAAGETIEQILLAHPRLTRKAVLAAIGFASGR
jgi:uncharacterized protein (DUF433 family)